MFAAAALRNRYLPVNFSYGSSHDQCDGYKRNVLLSAIDHGVKNVVVLLLTRRLILSMLWGFPSSDGKVAIAKDGN